MLDLAAPTDLADEHPDRRWRARLWRLALRGMAAAVLAVAVGVTLARAASPGGSVPLLWLAVVTWCAAIAAWGGWLLVAAAKSSGRDPLGRRVRWAARWLAVPLVFVATVAVASTDLPLRVGVRLAEPDMLAYVHSGGSGVPGHVGPYPVSTVDTSNRAVRFGVPAGGSLVYSVAGPCRPCVHVEGPWYVSGGDR
jgi:hypothetical protein